MLIVAAISACGHPSGTLPDAGPPTGDGPAADGTTNGDAAPLDASANPDGAVCDIPLRTTLGGMIDTWWPYDRVTTLWTGSSWLHTEVNFTQSAYTISSVRVSADGVRDAAHDLQSVDFTPGLSGIEGMTSAWTGTEALVAWLHWTNSFNVREMFVARVGADGSLLAPPTQLSLDSGGYYLTSAWTGTELGVVHGGPAIELSRIAPDGTRIGTPTMVTQTAASTPAAVAWNGEQYAIAWKDWQGLWIARVSADGLAETPLNIADATFAATSPPMIFARGTRWLIAIPSTATLRVFQLSAVGLVQGTFDVPLPDAWSSDDGSDDDGHRDDAVAVAPNGVLHVAWVVKRAALEIAYRRVAADGTLLGDPIDLTTHANPMEFGAQGPELLWSNDGLGLTWADAIQAGAEITRYLRSVCGG